MTWTRHENGTGATPTCGRRRRRRRRRADQLRSWAATSAKCRRRRRRTALSRCKKTTYTVTTLRRLCLWIHDASRLAGDRRRWFRNNVNLSGLPKRKEYVIVATATSQNQSKSIDSLFCVDWLMGIESVAIVRDRWSNSVADLSGLFTDLFPTYFYSGMP